MLHDDLRFTEGLHDLGAEAQAVDAILAKQGEITPEEASLLYCYAMDFFAMRDKREEISSAGQRLKEQRKVLAILRAVNFEGYSLRQLEDSVKAQEYFESFAPVDPTALAEQGKMTRFQSSLWQTHRDLIGAMPAGRMRGIRDISVLCTDGVVRRGQLVLYSEIKIDDTNEILQSARIVSRSSVLRDSVVQPKQLLIMELKEWNALTAGGKLVGLHIDEEARKINFLDERIRTDFEEEGRRQLPQPLIQAQPIGVQDQDGLTREIQRTMMPRGTLKVETE